MTVQNHLQYRDMVQIFKCKNDLGPKYLSTKLSQRSHVHHYRTRQHEDLNVARCRTALAQRAFFVRAPKSWNSLNKSNQSNCFAPAFQKNYYEGRIFLTLSFTYIFISILKSILSYHSL